MRLSASGGGYFTHGCCYYFCNSQATSTRFISVSAISPKVLVDRLALSNQSQVVKWITLFRNHG